MTKALLSLVLFFSLNIKAENIETAQAEETTTPELRICDFKSQAPVLVGYFFSSFAKGLYAGFGTNLVRSVFDTCNDTLDVSLYSTVLGADLLNNLDTDQETQKCTKIATLYNRNFVHPLVLVFGNKEDMFQPEQFKVQNRAYSVAATILGFASGAYLGSKLGTSAYRGCANVWNFYFPTQMPIEPIAQAQ